VKEVAPALRKNRKEKKQKSGEEGKNREEGTQKEGRRDPQRDNMNKSGSPNNLLQKKKAAPDRRKYKEKKR